MLLWIRILTTVLFSIFASILLLNVKNQSNFSPYIIIPLIVALLTKYSIGDWDKGFQWTILDISYWICIIGSSYGVVYLLTTKGLVR
jgi:ACR3 family arsenite efflux pump ArsB